MTNVPHELAEEFPEHAARIHDLKVSDDHFRHLADEHHRINREIHRIEVEVEPASDMRFEELKKERLALADEIHEILTVRVDG